MWFSAPYPPHPLFSLLFFSPLLLFILSTSICKMINHTKHRKQNPANPKILKILLPTA